jgi:hypothetical protein
MNTQTLTVSEIKSKLTSKEIMNFDSLVRLGDSIELAYETILSLRGHDDNEEAYRLAYTN